MTTRDMAAGDFIDEVVFWTEDEYREALQRPWEYRGTSFTVAVEDKEGD